MDMWYMVLMSKTPLEVGTNEELIEMLLMNLVSKRLVWWVCKLYLMAAVRMEER